MEHEKPTGNPDYVTAKEFADKFGVNKMTIYRMISDEVVKAIRVGKQWRIPYTEVERCERDGLQ